MPRVSLLVPIYNVQKYLVECLDSARAQTLEDIEVICINDGSTDGSRDIIQRYLDLDPRFRVIDKANSGYGDSMNRGLDAATGDYVGILESDDTMAPDALMTLVAAADEHSADLAKGNFNFYWSTPEERLEFYAVAPASYSGRAVDPRAERAMFYTKPSIWSAVYRRSYLAQKGIRFLATPGASFQDTSFAFKAWASSRRVTFVPNAVVNYRQDNEASSVNAPGKVFCVCDEYAEIERWLVENPELRASYEGVKERMKFDAYLWNYDRLVPELQARFLARASQELSLELASGDVELSLFSVSEEADLRGMAAGSEAFVASRRYARPGRANTLRRYWTLGGPQLVAKVLLSKRKG